MPELWNEQLDSSGNQQNRIFKGVLIGFTISVLFFWIPLWAFLLNWLVK